MTEQAGPTKSEVVQQLRSGSEDALKRLRAMPAESFEAGRYENGWNAARSLPTSPPSSGATRG